MTRRERQTRRRVWVGRKRVPLEAAALMGQEADRRHVAPSIVGRVDVPAPAPSHVEIAGKVLTVEAAARISSEADAQGVEPAKLIEDILEVEMVAATEKGDGRG